VNAHPQFDDRLLEAPSIYRTPYLRPSLSEAKEWCGHLTSTHYENFHVASFLLPRRLRPHFESVYAFCRTSDDLGDEVATAAIATELLGQWRLMLRECFEAPADSRHPVFIALRPTIEACALPQQPFDDLISAFEADQQHPHHESMASLEVYSRYSANPVGRLVLLLNGYRDDERMHLSDEVCTGLQLANFWQDIDEDRERGRRYIPADAMLQFGVSDAQIADRHFDENFHALMKFLVQDARSRLQRGSRLVGMVDRQLSGTLRLFVRGGLAILDAIEAQGYNTLTQRPVVTKGVKLKLLAGVLTSKVAGVFTRHTAVEGSR
jgi:squalene synthase HpnC